MFGNKEGNTTIESVIIVPIIMIMMVSFILVLITTYRFGVTVIDGLYVYIENHQEVTIEDEIRGIGFRKMVSLKYYETVVDSKVLQDYVEYMILPRMTALSEVVWSSKEGKNWEDFQQRLNHFAKRYDALNLNYAKHSVENK